VPTYQYACLDCAEDFEVRQSFTDPSLTECPVCEGRLRKVFNAVGIVFKGSGFYRTDSRATADDAPAKVNGSTDSSKDSATEKAGSGGETKTDKSGEKSRTSDDKGSANGTPKAAASGAASARS
jgi:putative FmdB family regulatory protein